MNRLLGVLLLMFISTSCFSWTVFGPKNYDECILENMKGVNTDVGARLVNKSCRKKFPEKDVVNSPKYNWTKVGVNEETTLYKDSSTKVRHGNIVTVYLMLDYDKVQKGNHDIQYYSDILKTEIDCVKRKSRYLKSEFKSGHMGDGDVVQTSDVITEYEIISKESEVHKSFCKN